MLEIPGYPETTYRDSKIATSCVIYPLNLKRDSSATNYLRPGDTSENFQCLKISMMGPIPSALGPIRIMAHGSQGPIRMSIILNLCTYTHVHILWDILYHTRPLALTLWYRFSTAASCSRMRSWALRCVAMRFSSWASWLSYMDLTAASSKLVSFWHSESRCKAWKGSPRPKRPYLAWYNSCLAFSACKEKETGY